MFHRVFMKRETESADSRSRRSRFYQPQEASELLSFPKISSRLKLLHLAESVDSLPTMNCVLASIISTLLVAFRSRLALQAEILALRHQLNLLRRSADARRHLRTSDRVQVYFGAHSC